MRIKSFKFKPCIYRNKLPINCAIALVSRERIEAIAILLQDI
ncbi:hypothetical protein [Nostoc sp. NMS7]|nr:hypothetical protein [Nostoc sp. NMS7]